MKTLNLKEVMHSSKINGDTHMKTLNMKKLMNSGKYMAPAALALVLTLSHGSVLAEEWRGNIGGMIGQVQLEDKDRGDQDDLGAIGLISDFRPASAPFSLAVDLIGSGDEDDSADRKDEIYSAAAHIGVRKVFDDLASVLKPYVGAGVALINAEMRSKDKQTGLSRTEDDSAAGYWIGVGSYVEISDHIQVGLDLRYSEADVTLFDRKRQAGGMQTAVTLGYHW